MKRGFVRTAFEARLALWEMELRGGQHEARAALGDDARHELCSTFGRSPDS